ncbi:Mutator family transposase [Legionella worsleiensis]|uniref:Mutator family transposase n=1 Tax=Legionella worsleiensis TaxID=45076 RepID=A0A0W1AFW9_9GAMM|nr:transposase [Legionella worsleiensis]STY31667.1 transposase [Legionella worsleiensis]
MPAFYLAAILQKENVIIQAKYTSINQTIVYKVLALYVLGMSYEAISEHLAEMYGLEVSSAKISFIADKLLPMITEWRNRSLESVYTIAFLDTMPFKVRVEGIQFDTKKTKKQLFAP